nr:hypothetical protein [Acholeplasmatales bacterium]
MKKSFKSLLLLGSVSLVSLTLASCNGTTRNSQTPYAGVYNNKDVVVATATNDKGDDFSMSLSQFYSRLRNSGYNTVLTSIKGQIYKNEYEAVKEVLLTEDVNSVSEKTKNLLTLTKTDTNEALYNLNETTLDYTKALNNYSYIRKQMVNAITTSLSSLIFSNSSASAIEAYTDEELETYFTKFVEGRARVGITITKENLAFTYPTDDTDLIIFTNFKDLIENHEDLVKTYILSQAEKLAGANDLYQIADQEYIYPYDADKENDEKTKNTSYYLFEDDSLKSTYESTVKTYATHKAVVTMYNSRSDAMNAVAKVEATLGYSLTDDNLTTDQVNAFYLALYQNTYKYKGVTDLDDEEFTFIITPEKNELSDLTSQAQTLITDTLEANEYLKEPRNLNDKYYLAYHISSTYDVSNSAEEKEYDDLSDDEKKLYNTIAKYNAIQSSASSYATTTYKSRLYNIKNNDDKNDDLKIYDPIMEIKYYNSYSDLYDLITAEDFNENLIYSFNGFTYSVADFYKDASKT